MIDIKKTKNDRYKFLLQLYETTKGHPYISANRWEIGNHLGFDKIYTDNINSYLQAESLVEFVDVHGRVKLTHAGRKAVEEALENPDSETEQLLPTYNISIGMMQNSQIIQGNKNVSKQEIESQKQKENPIKKHLTEIIVTIIGGLIVGYLLYKFGFN